MGSSCRTFREEPLARPCRFLNGALQPSRQNERCHETASDCLRLDRCCGDAGDTSTCRLLTRLPSRRTMRFLMYPHIRRNKRCALFVKISDLPESSVLLCHCVLICLLIVALHQVLGFGMLDEQSDEERQSTDI